MFENVLPFFCFIFFFFILSFLDIKHISYSSKLGKTVFVLAVFVLICFAGCRWSPWEVGVQSWIFDYDTYHTVFNEALPVKRFFYNYVNAPSEVQQMDIGYLLWNSVAHLIVGDNYNLFLLLTNAILVFLLLKGFVRNNITNGIFFILFFYTSRLYLQYNFILIRQAISLVIVWYAFRHLIHNNLKRYYFFVFIAISFHFSALICLFFPLVKKIHFKDSWYFTLLAVLLAIGFLGVSGQIIKSVLNISLSAVGIPMADRLIKYLELEGGSNILNFVEAVPFFYIAITNRKELLSSPEGRLYHNMLYCFIFLMAVTMNLSFFTRFWQYMIISYFYLLSYYHGKTCNRDLFLLLSCYCLLYSFRYIMIWFYDVPYSCFLFHL